jgi:hypothetical protein
MADTIRMPKPIIAPCYQDISGAESPLPCGLRS